MKNSDITIREANTSDQKTWDTLAKHPMQSWMWGEFRKNQKTTVARYIIEDKGTPSDVFQITFHAIPYTPWTIGYIPKSSLPTETILRELRTMGEKYHAVFIQLEPNVDKKTIRPASPAGEQKDDKTNSEIFMSNSLPVFPSLHPSHHPLFTKYTFVLDLTKSEEELLKAMHSKTRYNIKVAEKHNVVIKEQTNDEAFEDYLKLSEETTKRQGFYAHNTTYHRTLWQTLKKSNMIHLWTASYHDEVLASWILFTWKDAIYYPYGASSRNHREVMAPNLLLWKIVKWGKAHGYKTFDLWGALGPDPDSNDPWFGFHRFKEGYHPTLVEFIGSYDLVINPLLYTLYCFADTIRWTILKLKTKIM